MKELWASVPDYPDHEISSTGRVRKVRRRAGKMLLDALNRPVYYYFTPRSHINICGRHFSTRRLMAQVFLTDGDSIPKNKITRGDYTDLGTIQVTNYPPVTPPNSHAEAVAAWCQVNQINDYECQLNLAARGVHLKLKTIQAYRLRAGYKLK